ncbi:hypothetical protein [Natronorubrum sp. DTA7]|uniref:hypothetical protein n=1 Tax=Natronorubrum sp. DTA7 TaxID=3447016 RepID=UPI003F82B694
MIDATTGIARGRRGDPVSSPFARDSRPHSECKGGEGFLENEQLVDRQQAVDSDNGENDP